MKPVSGVLRFRESNCPGIYLSGSDALFYSKLLNSIGNRLRDGFPFDLELSQVSGLAQLLSECDPNKVRDYQIAGLITETAVRWRKTG